MVEREADDAQWNRSRLESYVGTTENLRLEFKSTRSLVPGGGKDKEARLAEAAKDVAAMANEQGGHIIYGLEEESVGAFKRAKRLEDGFVPGDGVSREWFLQFVRDRVQPPLPDIEAYDVPLGDNRFALVVAVPQARGSARQTQDSLFWRRDAQGTRRMTVQEIEDVRSRALRPVLELKLAQSLGGFQQERRRFDSRLDFDVTNPSQATSDFVVVTLGVPQHVDLQLPQPSSWSWSRSIGHWRLVRCVVASGSSRLWSPITPGYTLPLDRVAIEIEVTESDWDPEAPARIVAMARLDHTGGAAIYQLEFSVQYSNLALVTVPDATHETRVSEGTPTIFSTW